MTGSIQKIPNKELAFGKKLGEGGFGIVRKGSWGGEDVAIKTLRMTKLSSSLEGEFIREASAMAKLNHPRIIRLYGICVEPGHYSLVMALMPRGDLYGLLSEEKHELSWNLRWGLATDIGMGLSYLHSKKILHRDLKSLNILLDSDLRAKITDFGLAILRRRTSSLYTESSKGSVAWMAPELFARRSKLTEKADVYAYGMVLWEIASRQVPFSDAHNPQLIPTWIQQGEREEIPKNCPPIYAQVIQMCWKAKPEERPTAAEALQMLSKDTDGSFEKVNLTEPINKPNVLQTSSTLSNANDGDKGIVNYKLAMDLYMQCKYSKALPYFKAAAEASYPPAYLKLFDMYNSFGKIGLKNPKVAGEWKIKAEASIKWFWKEVEGGMAEAEYDLGFCYEKGIGLDKDEKQAAKYYQLAADQKNLIAITTLGSCYFHGKGVIENRVTAAEYWKLAAQKEFAPAQRNIGLCYQWGWGVSKNEQESLKYLKAAAEQGLASAQNNLGEWYFVGRGTPKSTEWAVHWFKLAKEQGELEAFYNLGLCYKNGTGVPKNEKDAVPCFRQAADCGYVGAQLLLGICYQFGKGVSEDHKKAVKYYQLAAAQGNVAAQRRLGICYEFGSGVSKDLKEATKYYKLAADKGDNEAQFNLGVCYAKGWGVSTDEKEAVRYYKLAASQGNGQAQTNLGLCYWVGRGVNKNEVYAAQYFKQAANQGIANAQYLLGKCYGDGTGVLKDEIKAVKFYWASAKQGFASAQRSLGQSYFYGRGIAKDQAEGLKYLRMAAAQGDTIAKNMLRRW